MKFLYTWLFCAALLSTTTLQASSLITQKQQAASKIENQFQLSFSVIKESLDLVKAYKNLNRAILTSMDLGNHERVVTFYLSLQEQDLSWLKQDQKSYNNFNNNIAINKRI